MGIGKRAIAVWGASALGALFALGLLLSCGKPPAGGGEFTLIADSMGEVPMGPDALKLDNLANASDGSMETRWTTVVNMEPGFFIEMEFDRPRKISGLVLNSEPSPKDFPRGFVVEVSRDGKDWEEAATGGPKATKKGITTINFDHPRTVRYIMITLNKPAGFWWSIYELEVKYAE
jgi:hypothetical protein